jgi:hypothetical protein
MRKASTATLLNNLLAAHWYLGPRPRRSSIRLADETGRLADETGSLADQMIMTLECLQLLFMLVEEGPHDEPFEHLQVKQMLSIGLFDVEMSHMRRAALMSHFNLKEASRQLDRLIARPGLLLHLRASLWSLYWMIHEPTEAKVSRFIEEVRAWAQGSMVPEDFWVRWLGREPGLCSPLQ